MFIPLGRDWPRNGGASTKLWPSSSLKWLVGRMGSTGVPTGPGGDPRIRLDATAERRRPDRRWLWVSLILVGVVIILVVGIQASGILTVHVGTQIGIPIATALNLSVNRDSSGLDSVVSTCSVVACNFYNFSILQVHSNLPFGDMFFGIQNPERAYVTIEGGLVIVGSSGILLGSFDSGFNGHDNESGSDWWTPSSASDTNLVRGDTMVVYTSGSSPLDLSGYQLIIIGAGVYSSAVAFSFA